MHSRFKLFPVCVWVCVCECVCVCVWVKERERQREREVEGGREIDIREIIFSSSWCSGYAFFHIIISKRVLNLRREKYFFFPGKDLVGRKLGLSNERCVLVLSYSVVSNSLRLHGLQPATVLCPLGFSRQEHWVGCHALLQGIFATQGSNPGVPHCRWILYRLSHQGSGLVEKYASQSLNLTPDMPGELTDILQNYHGDYHGDFHGDFSNSCPFALGIQWIQTMQSCVLR